MSKKFPFPYQCENFPIFKTKNEAQTFIEAYQAKGHIKRCSHVKLDTCGDGHSWYAEFYRPKCEEDSFESQDQGRSESLFFGCPADCKFYEPAWLGKIKRWRKNCRRSFRQFVVATLDRYQSFSPTAQILWPLIILAILALLGSPLFEMILRGFGVILGN